MFVRPSKFRHVFGCPFKKESCYEGLKATKSAHDTNFCAVNPIFLAIVVESSGGGSFVVLPIEKTGRIDVNVPKICGHRAAICDLKWCPHNDYNIASCSDDATIKVWSIPDGSLFHNITEPLVDLANGHHKKVTYIEWHPCTQGVILSAGADYKCIVWDVREGAPLNEISIHQDMIFSISWNSDGSLFATTCKDKMIRVIDPRSGNVVAQGMGHQGNKASKAIFLNGTQVFTTGFSRTSERQYALWDYTNLSRAIKMEEVDSSCGSIIPFFDPDLNIVYLAGKGDGNIRYVEVVQQPPFIYFLNQYQSNIPQRGLGMMPKRGLDMKRCEIARFYKLHSSKDICEPISMIVPRKSDNFQTDIYPTTLSNQPCMTADEWMSGLNKPPILIQLQSGILLPGSCPLKPPAIQQHQSVCNTQSGLSSHSSSDNRMSKSLQHGLSAVGRSNTFSASSGFHEESTYSSATNLTTNESLKKPRTVRRKRRTRLDYEDDALKNSRSSLSSCDGDDDDDAGVKKKTEVPSQNMIASKYFCDDKTFGSPRSKTDPSHDPMLLLRGQADVIGTKDFSKDVTKDAPSDNDIVIQNAASLNLQSDAVETDDANGDSDKHGSRVMLDCISMDAPDDAVILPSKLRASMSSRHRRVARSGENRSSCVDRMARVLNPELNGLIRVGSVREKSRNYNSILDKEFFNRKSDPSSIPCVEGENSCKENDNVSKSNPSVPSREPCGATSANNSGFPQQNKLPVAETRSMDVNISFVSPAKVMRSTARVTPTNVSLLRRLPGRSLNEFRQSLGAPETHQAPSGLSENGAKTTEDFPKKSHQSDRRSIDGVAEEPTKEFNYNNNYISSMNSNNKRSSSKQSVSFSHAELLQEYLKQQQEIKNLKALLEQKDAKMKKLEDELLKYRGRRMI